MYGKPNVVIFNIAIFIQFNPYPFNLIFKFIQFNLPSFNLIPIVIIFNSYSFNSIFRSIQFNFCILDSISVLVQFNFCIRSIQSLYSFNLTSVFIQFTCFIHSIQLLYSFNSIVIFIRYNLHIHSFQSVYIHSIFALIYSILGSGSSVPQNFTRCNRECFFTPPHMLLNSTNGKKRTRNNSKCDPCHSVNLRRGLGVQISPQIPV